MSRRNIAIGILILAIGGGGGFFALSRASDKNGAGKDEAGRAEGKTAVRVVHPRLDPMFRIANQQIAVVEPFYQAGLRARSAGLVRSVRKEIGESVRMGEVLVEIDAPDLEQDVEQKEAVIRQREQELRVSRAMLGFAEAVLLTADVMINQRTAEAKQAAATRDYKQKLLARLRGLLDQTAIRPEVVDENEKDFLAAEAALEAAQVAIQKAKADRAEKRASLVAARADNELKAALIAVAEKDRDKAAATAGFARIRAPFDGVIVRRNVDPGMFVQNATTGASEPLVTVARIDLLTVTTKLPAEVAPYLSKDTDVEVTFDDLPGLTVHGKVTRFSPAIDGADRTVRVALDVFNGTRSDFRAFLASAQADALASLAGASPLGTVAAILAADAHQHQSHKGVSDGTAICPDSQFGTGGRPLVPGMSASMKVYLDRVSAAYLLPSSAVYSQGGKTYILVVQDGMTQQIPVRVQVNDGRMAKVALLATTGEGGTAVRELTGNEEVVVSRQMEVGDRAKVRTVVGDW